MQNATGSVALTEEIYWSFPSQDITIELQSFVYFCPAEESLTEQTHYPRFTVKPGLHARHVVLEFVLQDEHWGTKQRPTVD